MWEFPKVGRTRLNSDDHYERSDITQSLEEFFSNVLWLDLEVVSLGPASGEHDERRILDEEVVVAVVFFWSVAP